MAPSLCFSSRKRMRSRAKQNAAKSEWKARISRKETLQHLGLLPRMVTGHGKEDELDIDVAGYERLRVRASDLVTR